MSDTIMQGDVNGQEPGSKKKLQNYKVFMQRETGVWKEIATLKAGSSAEAKRLSVQGKEEYINDIRAGRLTLVAVGARLWNPSTPQAEPQPDKLIW